MTNEAWGASMILALIGYFLLGYVWIEKPQRWRITLFATGTVFVMPLLVRVWIVAVAG